MRRNKKTRGFFAKHTGQAAASKTFAKQMMEMPTNPDPVWKAALLFQGELDHIDDAMGHTVDSVSDELTMKRPTNDAMFGLLEQFISLYGYFDQFYEAFQAGNGVTPPVETSQNAVSLGYPLDITYWNDALNASGGQPVNVEGNTAEDAMNPCGISLIIPLTLAFTPVPLKSPKPHISINTQSSLQGKRQLFRLNTCTGSGWVNPGM